MKDSSVRAVVGGLDPSIYDADQQVKQIMMRETPEATAALAGKAGFYEGVPTNFFTNRLRILQ